MLALLSVYEYLCSTVHNLRYIYSKGFKLFGTQYELILLLVSWWVLFELQSTKLKYFREHSANNIKGMQHI